MSRQRRSIFLFVLATAAAAGAAYALLGGRDSSAKPPAAPARPPAIAVEVAPARTMDVPLYVESTGTVAASSSVLVRSRAEGQLIEVAFAEGQAVGKGDVLARIDPAPYQARLKEARARRAAVSATLANTRLELARYEGLVAQGFASAQVLDEKRARVAQQQAALAEAEAQIESLQIQLGHTTIRAPIAGRAGPRLLDAGNLVRASEDAPLVSIVQTSPVYIKFAVPARLLPDIQEAMRSGAPEVSAMAVDGKGAATGQLTLVSNEIDQATAQIQLKATFRNEERSLWPGQALGVRLKLGVRRAVLVAPPSAIQTGPAGHYVFVVGKGDQVERRAVSLLSKDSQWAVLGVAGQGQGKGPALAAGDRLVTDGQNKIEEGSIVAPRMRPVAAAPAPQLH